jgi:hypothetical protein
MAQAPLPTQPPTAATPGAGDAPPSQDDQLVSLLDAADADEATPPEEQDEEQAPDEGADEQDEDEPKPVPTDEMDREYEVRPDGKPEKVTLREALRRYTHIATAERRMAEATEARKALELEKSAELGKLSQVRGEYAKRLDALAQSLEEAEPDWDAIRRDRPDEYPQLLADWQLRERKRQKVATERERVADEQEQDAAQRLQAHLAREQQKLHEFLPDLADRTKGPAIKADLLAAGEEYGYTPEEVESVVDHRAIRLLHDAAQYRKLLARKAALGKAPEGKTLTPGPKASVPSGTKARGAAYDRLKKTGSKEDAVAVFLGMLDDDERSAARKR